MCKPYLRVAVQLLALAHDLLVDRQRIVHDRCLELAKFKASVRDSYSSPSSPTCRQNSLFASS